MSTSCLVAKFGRYLELSAREQDVLEDLEKSPRRVPAGGQVRAPGEPRELYVLHDGWAISYQLLSNGRRQICDLHVPGDILGMRDLGARRTNVWIDTLNDVQLCPFSKVSLSQVFANTPRVAALLLLISTREQALLQERIVGLGRRDAYQRLSHFLLEMMMRLFVSRASFPRRFLFPLNQPLLADLLGLSVVHVHRTLKRLRNAKLANVSQGVAEILDLEGLAAVAEFDPVYLEEDARWIQIPAA